MATRTQARLLDRMHSLQSGRPARSTPVAALFGPRCFGWDAFGKLPTLAPLYNLHALPDQTVNAFPFNNGTTDFSLYFRYHGAFFGWQWQTATK